MRETRAWNPPELPVSLAEAQGEFHILDIGEEVGPKQSNVPQRLSPKEEAATRKEGAGTPRVTVLRRRPCDVIRDFSLMLVRPQGAEPGVVPSREPDTRRRIIPNDERRKCPNPHVQRGGSKQPRKTTGVGNRIVVHHQHPRRAALECPP